jgi:hypothetical protein
MKTQCHRVLGIQKNLQSAIANLQWQDFSNTGLSCHKKHLSSSCASAS